MRKISFSLLAAACLLLPLLVACIGETDTTVQETAEALKTVVVATMTARSADITPDNSLANAQTTATAVSQSMQSTQTAQISQDSSSQKATDDAFARFRGELPQYGVDPNQGHPGWIHPPLKLELNEYHDYDFGNQFIGTVAEDFVVSADITWNTDYGGSGCGFMLRADGDKQRPNAYMILATRGASGHIVFAVISDGELVGGQDIYAYGIDRSFNYQNGGTNKLAVVGRGNLFEIYSNGVKIGEFDPNTPTPKPRIPTPPPMPADVNDPVAMAKYNQAKAEYDLVIQKINSDIASRVQDPGNVNKNFERGFVAMVAASESGHTECQYDNAWLWLIDK